MNKSGYQKGLKYWTAKNRKKDPKGYKAFQAKSKTYLAAVKKKEQKLKLSVKKKRVLHNLRSMLNSRKQKQKLLLMLRRKLNSKRKQTLLPLLLRRKLLS